MPGLEEFWRYCIDENTGDLFVTYNYDWISLWRKYVYESELRKSHQIFVLVAKRGEEIVGVFPMMVARYKKRGVLPYRCLYFLGHGMVDHADVVIDPSLSERARTEIIARFFDHLNGVKYAWDEAKLDLIPDGSPNLKVIMDLLSSDKPHRLLVSPTANLLIDTKSQKWDAFIAKKGKDITSDVRRRINKLARLGAYKFKCTRGDDVDGFFSAIKEIHIQRQRVLHRVSFYERPALERFVREIVRLSSERGLLDYSVLELDGEVISYMFGFRVNSIRYSWNVGFLPGFDFISPGKIILYLWIKEAFENPSIQEFNFMRGNAPFKRKWTQSARYTQKLKFLSPNCYSQVLSTIQDRLS